MKGKHEYAEDQRPCLVARKSCGHYVAAAGLDVEDIVSDGENSIVQWANDALSRKGVTLEIRPVSFVRSGGLTFDCRCAAGGAGRGGEGK